jgi:DNA-binding protein HU-beta
VTKTELIQEMSKVLDSQKDAKAVMESLIANIIAEIKKGGSITLSGFGTFKVAKRKARDGRNPRTGEKIKIKPKKVVQFVPGKKLKEAVN